MSQFATIVDDVIVSVHRAVQEDIKANSQSRIKRRNSHDGQTALSKGITEQYFEENRAKLKDFITEELRKLLNAKCDVKFLERYIKHSGRSYIKIYEKHGAKQRIGDTQLANFFEAKINYVLHKEKNLTLKMDVISYLRGSELIDEEEEHKNEEEIDKEAKEELKNYLISRKVNEFWINLEKQKASEQDAMKSQAAAEDSKIKLVLPGNTASRFKENSNCYQYKWKDDPLRVIQELDKKCEFYIRNRYAKLKKLEVLLPKECILKPKKKLESHSNGALYIDSENITRLPTAFEFDSKQQNKNKNTVIDEIKTVAEQYNKMQELRLKLHTKDVKYSEKISLFRDAYINKENQNILNKDIDGVLKKVLFAISNLLTGQFFLRGTFRFWRTDTDLLGEVISDYAPLKPVEIKTKVVSQHTEASPRRGR